MELVTEKQLRELYVYHPDTGTFTFRSGSKEGQEVGTPTKHGYVVCTIAKRQYYIHRLVWLWHKGYHCPFMVDHKDGDRSNNRIQNLRMASRGHNRQNLRKVQHNKTSSKYVGVYANKSAKNPYIARISFYGKQINLGSYESEEVAFEAYKNAKVQLHTVGGDIV